MGCVWGLTGECEVPQDIVFPRLDGGHLFKEVLPSEEADGSEERNHPDPHPVVASVPIVIEQTSLPPLCPVVAPPLRGNAPKHYYRE